MSEPVLTAELASVLAQSALARNDHACDVRERLQNYWVMAAVSRRFPHMVEARAIAGLLSERFAHDITEGKLSDRAPMPGDELAAAHDSTWVLMLAAELLRFRSAQAAAAYEKLKPIARAQFEWLTRLLPQATTPVRAGTQENSALVLTLALEFARATDDKRFRRLLAGRATSWFSRDVGAALSPPEDGEFLSPELMEAECMHRSMDAAPFMKWFGAFLPDISAGPPELLFAPPTAGRLTDQGVAHLHVLSLSRAWCLRSIARSLADADERKAVMLTAAERLLAVSLAGISSSEHEDAQIGAFVTLALTA